MMLATLPPLEPTAVLVVRAARWVGDTVLPVSAVSCGEAHLEAHQEADPKVPHA